MATHVPHRYDGSDSASEPMRCAGPGDGLGSDPSPAAPRHLELAAFALWAQPARAPLPTPPAIFDLVLAALFALGGWRVWKKGRGWRSGALVLWLLALGGLYTYIRSF